MVKVQEKTVLLGKKYLVIPDILLIRKKKKNVKLICFFLLRDITSNRCEVRDTIYEVYVLEEIKSFNVILETY